MTDSPRSSPDKGRGIDLEAIKSIDKHKNQHVKNNRNLLSIKTQT